MTTSRSFIAKYLLASLNKKTPHGPGHVMQSDAASLAGGVAGYPSEGDRIRNSRWFPMSASGDAKIGPNFQSFPVIARAKPGAIQKSLTLVPVWTPAAPSASRDDVLLVRQFFPRGQTLRVAGFLGKSLDHGHCLFLERYVYCRTGAILKRLARRLQ
jgi:hypothetical protein